MVKRLFEYRFTYKTVLIFLIIGFCLLIVPMLYVAKWNVPTSDDFAYGKEVHDALMRGEGFWNILTIAVKQALKVYYTWQGSACAVFLFGLQPSVFGEQYYALVPYIMLAALISGIYIFIKSFFELFGASRQYCLIISVIILIACTQFLPHAVESFYWYNGSVYYTFIFGISLILYTMLIKLICRPVGDKGIGRIIIICFLCVFIGLGNLITALTTAIILGSLLVLTCIISDKKKLKSLIFPVLFFGIAFYLNVSAPGNEIRQAELLKKYSYFETIIRSIKQTYIQILEWNNSPVLAMYLFLCPLLWKIASKADYSFSMPWIVTLYSFCLIAAMNCPSIYATSIPGQGRILNIMYFMNIILIVINLFYWFGWLSKNCFNYIGKGNLQVSVRYLLFVGFVLTLNLIRYPGDRITSVSAFRSYKNGEMGAYKHVYNQRLEVLNDPEIRDAVLRRFPEKLPYVLYFDDIITNIEDNRNKAMSEYFHKNSVRLSYPGEEVSHPTK